MYDNPENVSIVEDYGSNYKTGWIKLYRSITNHWLFKKSKTLSEFEAWIDLLIMVNHKDEKILIGNELFTCKRGQSFRSVETYQKRWNWSRQKVRTFLNLLKSDSMIELKTTNKTTMLTICNYDIYQSEQPTDNQRITNGQPTDNQRITINKNDKNDNNEKNNNKFDFKKSLLNLGIDEKIVAEWLVIRKSKKLTNSETAFNHIKKNIELSNRPANECIKTAVERSWGGFEASWLTNLNEIKPNKRADLKPLFK